MLRYLNILVLILFFSVFSYGKENVKTDCTMVSSDVAIFLQKILREVRNSTPPKNACGVSGTIRIAYSDKNLETDDFKQDAVGSTPINFKNHFDFYFDGIKSHLENSFRVYNLNIPSKEARLNNEYRVEVGANHQYVAPAGTVVFAHDLLKKTYQDPKEPWGVNEPLDRDIEEPEKCNFFVYTNFVWVVSEPKNSISGFVNKIDKNGNKQKLKKGKVKFTRKGPNNGNETDFETEIKDGYYKTDPKLPSGHYKIELTKPKECKKIIENNWVFTSGNMMTKSFDIKCEENNFFTVKTTERTTSIVKPIENYRGINKPLKSYEEDKDVYYIYIDTDKAKIEQYHINKLSTRKIHKEAYKLNMKSCQYEVKSKDRLVKNLGGSPILKSEDAGWGFDDNTKIYVDLPSSNKTLSFTWGRLRKDATYHANKKYKKEIPKIVKELMGKVNGMATLFRNESKNSKEMEYFKSLYDYPGTSQHVQCGGKVAMESLLIPPLDGFQDPEVKFSINIRPSNKNEKKVMKAYLKRF